MCDSEASRRLGQRFERALVYACQVHRDVRRKGTGTPYIGHLLGVAAIVIDSGADEDEAIAALLHDAVEEAGGRQRLEEIRAMFGDRVAGIVEGCSDCYGEPKPPWKERKEAYVRQAASAPPSVCLVSAADKLYNLRSIIRDYRQLGEQLWQRFRAAKEQVLWYYSELSKVYRLKVPAAVADELTAAMAELRRLVQSGSEA